MKLFNKLTTIPIAIGTKAPRLTKISANLASPQMHRGTEVHSFNNTFHL